MTGRRQGAAGDECCPHLASNSPRPDLRAGTFSPIPVPSHLPPASASYISHSFHLFLGQKLFIAQAEKRRGGWRGEDRAVEGVHTLSPSLPTPQTRAAPSPVPAARKQPSLPPLPPPHRKRARACARGQRTMEPERPAGARGKQGRGSVFPSHSRRNSRSRLSNGSLRAPWRTRGAQLCSPHPQPPSSQPPSPQPPYPAGHSPVLQRAPNPSRGGCGETRLG